MIVVGAAGNLGIEVAAQLLKKPDYQKNIVLVDYSFKNVPVDRLLPPSNRLRIIEDDGSNVGKAIQTSRFHNGDQELPSIIYVATTIRESNDVAKEIAALCQAVKLAHDFSTHLIVATWDEDAPTVTWEKNIGDWKSSALSLARGFSGVLKNHFQARFPLTLVRTGEMIGGYKDCVLKVMKNVCSVCKTPDFKIAPGIPLTPVSAVAKAIVDAGFIREKSDGSRQIDARWTDCQAGFVWSLVSEFYKRPAKPYDIRPADEKVGDVMKLILKK